MNAAAVRENIRKKTEEGYIVEIGDCLTESWEIFKKYAGGFILYLLLIMAINFVLAFIPIVGSLISFVLQLPFLAGFHLVSDRISRGEEPEFSDFFKGFDYLSPLILAQIVVSIFVTLGTVLLILPGIYLAVAYLLVLPAILFARLDFWEAMEASRKFITKKWFSFFAFCIVLFLLNLAGALALGIGLLITVPVTYISIYVLFRQLAGAEEGEVSIEDHFGE